MANNLTAKDIRFFFFIILGISVFSALGVWQVKRMAWKQDLIRAVEVRVNQHPIPSPAPENWPEITRKKHEYAHVSLSGRYLNEHETYVHSTTVYGMGFWVMTPFKTDQGFIVLVNRGYAPYSDVKSGVTDDVQHIQGQTTVNGLLRISEPEGGFLRRNNPAQNLWYSRDVKAILQSHAIQQAISAPYFIDAKPTQISNQEIFPIAGLTVINFSDNHLVYALTWFGLALLTLIYGVIVRYKYQS